MTTQRYGNGLVAEEEALLMTTKSPASAPSPKGSRIVSVDEQGKLRVWDPSKPEPEKRIWNGNGFTKATAVGITDDGKRLAVATELIINVYDLESNQPAKKLEEGVTLPLKEKITFLQFTDNDHVVCSDIDGKKVIFQRDPA